MNIILYILKVKMLISLKFYIILYNLLKYFQILPQSQFKLDGFLAAI